MREFDLVIPKSLPDALDALAANDVIVQPLAGGTDMIVNIRARVAQPNVLVSLNDIAELREIRRDNGTIVVGGGARIADFLKHPLLIENAEIARQAAFHFANPMIRNLATAAGNLASASPAGDMSPPLLALGAEVALASKAGTRTLPLDQFFISVRKTARRPDEIISALRWQVPPQHTGHAFYKMGLRAADAISVISVAVVIERAGDTIREARLALGAVAPRPMRAYQAEALLNSQKFTDAIVQEAARLASEECSPIDDLRGTASYRRRMVKVYVARMLRQAWERAK